MATVNNQIITSYDANELAKRLNITQKQALEVLIDDHVKNIEIQRLGLGVSQGELDASAAKLGLSTHAQIEGLKEKLNEQRFFSFILDNARINADPVILRNFYEMNKERFATFAKIDLVLLSASSQEPIKRAIKNPMHKEKGLSKKTLHLSTAELNPQLISLLNRTKAGSFTPIFNTGDGFLAYFVKAKTGEEKLSFEQVEPRVREAFMAKQERLYLQNYLNRLKANAQIIILPKPAAVLKQ